MMMMMMMMTTSYSLRLLTTDEVLLLVACICNFVAVFQTSYAVALCVATRPCHN